MKRIHCGDCVYHELIKPDPSDPDRGHVCRLNPPQIVKVFDDTTQGTTSCVSRFPWVHPRIDWCGHAVDETARMVNQAVIQSVFGKAPKASTTIE